jgi:hypothetical protein
MISNEGFIQHLPPCTTPFAMFSDCAFWAEQDKLPKSTVLVLVPFFNSVLGRLI